MAVTALPPPLPGLHLPLSRRRLGSGTALAVITHAAIIGMLLARPARHAGQAAGGATPPGRQINFFALPKGGPTAVDVATALRITPSDLSAVQRIPVDLPPLDIPRTTLAPPTVVLGGGGGSAGGGQGAERGAGGGAGPGSGTGGEGGYIVSAQPRRVIPRPPECILNSVPRGRITVSFSVGADGQPTRVDVDPPPTDEECRRAFVALMMETRFVPATLHGQPVASVFSIRYTRSN